MKVAVVGLWHLGTVTAACLAAAGHQVLALDEAETVHGLQSGHLPVDEPGLAELALSGLASGRLRFSADPRELRDAEVTWIAYDTPVDDDDRADVNYVSQKVAALFPHLPKGSLVLVSSQVPAGTTRTLEALYRRTNPDGQVTFGYSPENLRLGRAIEAFTRPARVVVGIRSDADRQRVAALLGPITERIEWTSVESAEMTKHALNSFLATCVTFANELATLCERVGADSGEVERALRSDPRVGPRAYVRPGAAFAGGTLARDVSFLIDAGHEANLPTHLFSGVLRSNEAHKRWAERRLVDLLGELQGLSVAVLGLTYKPGTDTLRRSSAVETSRRLRRLGANVTAFDPAVRALPPELGGVIDLRPSTRAALLEADAALVATEWPEFKRLRGDDLVSWMRRPLVLDPGRFLEANLRADGRVEYVTVGRLS
ncbi:MAG: nucleotide sugar dehydrogenase [Chloroflexi bacterium]|nr:nucleotide sugar dehydrogenase [Chloroflexota bacterium]MCL5109042.1 nucleotide sugar dehydrogenase [Chloroflexota bacterium]